MAHRCHDYRHLSARWRAVARESGFASRTLCEASGMKLSYLRSPALADDGGIYLSAGIHGDEPGATEGLLSWATMNRHRLAALPLLIFPCLNPWGLTQNRRTDEHGIDLNRCFHNDRHPTVAAVRRIVGNQRFDAALMLHEDYDGEGVYLCTNTDGVSNGAIGFSTLLRPQFHGRHGGASKAVVRTPAC